MNEGKRELEDRIGKEREKLQRKARETKCMREGDSERDSERERGSDRERERER